jgi:hypothetical protein
LVRRAKLRFNCEESSFNGTRLRLDCAWLGFNSGWSTFNPAESRFDRAESRFNRAESRFDSARLKVNSAGLRFDSARLKVNSAGLKFNPARSRFSRAEESFSSAESKVHRQQEVFTHRTSRPVNLIQSVSRRRSSFRGPNPRCVPQGSNLSNPHERNNPMKSSDPRSPVKLEIDLSDISNGLTGSSNSLLNSLVVLGVVMSKASILAKAKSYLQVLTPVDQTKHAYLAALATRNASLAEIHSFVAGLSLVLKQTLGPANHGELGSFGILPPTPRKAPSAETKALATVKAAETRKARGTKGKRQRLAIPPVTNVTLRILGPDGQPVDGGAPSTSSPASTTPP